MNDKVKFKFEEQYQTFNRENAWTKVFELLNRSTYGGISSDQMSVARSVKNSDLNRYIDVVPFNDSRVKLQTLDNDYINASLIKVDDAKRNYILTQGPLSHTTQDFWTMIWQQNSRAIVMLNKLTENGLTKCFHYWPTKKKNLKLDHIDLEIELISEKEDGQNDFVVRQFKLINHKDKTDRIVLQFHSLCWPDIDVPKSPTAFVNFLHACRQSEHFDSNNYGPPVIHCSAGIGRSGTFILVDSFLIMLNKSIKEGKKQPEVLELLLRMRNYRLGLVQTSQQLRFAYEAIISAINSELFQIESNQTAASDSNEKSKSQENETELRRRVREEKKRNTMMNINRIKAKQKEIDAQNKKTRYAKYIGATILVTSILVGSLYYKYRSSFNYFH